MHLLVLSWDATDPRGGPDPVTAATVRSLATEHAVTLVARPPVEGGWPDLDGADVLGVVEPPPIVTGEVGGRLAPVLALASRASAAVEGRLRRDVVDAVVAVGWQTAWTAAAVRDVHAVPIVARLDTVERDRTPGPLAGADLAVHQAEWWLAYESRRLVAATPALLTAARRALRTPRAETAVVPAALDPVDATPAARADGPVVLHLPPGAPTSLRRAVARTAGRDRPVVAGWGATMPAAVVALDVAGLADALRAVAAGVPLVVGGQTPLRDLVHARRTGLRVPADPDVVADAVATALSPRGRAMATNGLARARDRHAPASAAAALVATAEAAVVEEAALRAGPPRPHVVPVPPSD